jgi:hypothetical protein
VVRDETRLPTAASADLGFETFRSGAAAELLSHSADISRILAAAENSPARWHPNSFVVFELPLVGRWGDLRLHVWPVGDRVVRGWGPTVHRHGWHLASHVLAGCYSDVLFEDGSMTRSFHRTSSPRRWLSDRGRASCPRLCWMTPKRRCEHTAVGL